LCICTILRERDAMPRPRKHRCCRRYRAGRIYKPQGIPLREIGATRLALDQFEALRLCDGEGLDQATAGERMGVSRGTVQRLLAAARKALVEGILRRDALFIDLQPEEPEDESLHPHHPRHRSRRRGV
jgi:predicted DNA-binding protein (UPF0251 family)